MRCVKCNVDLGKDYQLCPLCGSEAVDEKPVIKDIATAEYPDVEYRPYRKRYVLILFVIYIAFIGISMVIEKLFTTNIGYSVLAAFVLPNIWVLFVRPFVIKKDYIGNYLNYDVLFLSLFMLYISRISTGTFTSALSKGIPLLLITCVAALLIYSLADRHNRVTSLSYILSAAAISIALLIMSIFISGFSYLFPLISLCFCVLSIAIIKVIAPRDFSEELKAKFRA